MPADVDDLVRRPQFPATAALPAARTMSNGAPEEPSRGAAAAPASAAAQTASPPEPPQFVYPMPHPMPLPSYMQYYGHAASPGHSKRASRLAAAVEETRSLDAEDGAQIEASASQVISSQYVV